ncbi:hypothetical protein CC80DRAFT_489778 [Byssothecium circinans]|uniref:Putative transcription factor kapC n=1 Tax=Byssothecium circinans TaxID=147558 RepID=A0A6A5UEZ2_9PLEO|nr:hypothetical protein CC80DRAFT_489778 [Byssothecium circinans]
MPSSLPTLYPNVRTYDEAMQQPAQEPKGIEMSLREHLLAAGAGQPSAPQPLQQHPVQQHSPQQHAIDPQIAGPQYTMSQGEAPEADMGDNRKGRRELSTSKRAAQNRAAQRAFRQRKEEYINKLKDQVKEFEQLCELYKTLQTENYQLRDYIINLQSRLLETQGEIPPAPAGVDLSRNQHGEPSTLNHTNQQPQPEQAQAQQQSQSNNGGLSERQIGELQMAAQAAAAAQHNGKHPNDGSLVAGDYSDNKRQKTASPVQGTQPVDTTGL